MKLDQAIEEQVSRYTNEETQNTPLANEELRNLLQAFISLINAYLQRVGETPTEERTWPKVSDTFGSVA